MSKKVPDIRFSGFEGEWAETTLGNLSKIVVRKASSNSTAPVMMITASNGFINQNQRYSTDNAGSSLANYTLLLKGELAYNHGFSKMRNFGSCFDLQVEEARIPFVYHTFSLPSENPTFFSYYLNSGQFDRELKKLVSSTARMDGLLNISYETYMTLPVNRPSKGEQDRISTLFSTLDKLIRSLELKLEKLRNLKQSLLRQMFTNANGGG